MKYFTKEELEDITQELLTNPTRETLKSLNEKYNSISEDNLIKTLPNESVEPPVVEPIPTVIAEETRVVMPEFSPVEEIPVVSPIPNIEIPKEENNISTVTNIPEIPNIESQQNQVQNFNNQNNDPINFAGNPWEQQAPTMENLMQTTDNFNSVPNNTMPTTEVPVMGTPFFGPIQETVNNPIPVNNAPVQGPTMFGQFEQNYM